MFSDMKTTRTETKVKGNEFLTMKVEIRPEHMGWGENEVEGPPMPDLTITGTMGYILSERDARREALQFWESFFEDSPEEIKAMNARFGTRFRSPRSAARYVLSVDGEYHGLDVVNEEDGKVYVAHSCGCLHDNIAEWFPDAVKHIPYHLNTHEGLFGARRMLPTETLEWATR